MVTAINKLLAGFVGVLGLIVFVLSFLTLGIVGKAVYAVLLVTLIGGLLVWGVLALGYKIYKIFFKSG